MSTRLIAAMFAVGLLAGLLVVACGATTSSDDVERSAAFGRRRNGATCTRNLECASGFCVSGVCCNQACRAACAACNLAGTVGTCTALPAGSTCGSGGTCSASGACLLPNGAPCTQSASCASGFCVNGVCAPSGS